MRARLLTGFMLLGALVVVSGALYIRLADIHLQPVLSGSMRPTIQPGDLAVTRGTPLASIAAGDVIAFYPPGSTEATLHRIATVSASGRDRAITTKGDANNAADPWTARIVDPTVYRLVAVVPLLGWLTEIRSFVFIAAGLALLAVALQELRKMRRGGRLATVPSI
jgi:signal peptidase I